MRARLVAVALLASSPVLADTGPAPAAPTADALLSQAEQALARDELPAAARAFRQAAEASPDEGVAEQACRFAYENHQLDETLLAARRWLEINPSSEAARRYAGVAALGLHRLDEATAQFADLIGSAYVSPAAGYVALLPVVMGEGTAPDVTEVFRRLVAKDAKVAEGHDALGNAALRSENYALAESSAREAVRLAPYWVPARLLLARTLIARGHDEEGLAMARDLAVAPEADVATHMEYALVLAALGRDQEARAILTPYATGDSVLPAAVRTLGLLDLDAGDLTAAAARFESLLSMGAQSYDAIFYLGVIADRRNDDATALRYYSKVTSGDQAMAAQQRLAVLVSKKDGLDAGLARLAEFGRAHPDLGPQVAIARAALATSLGNEPRALEVLDAGVAQYPDVLDLHLSRVFTYERMGRGADSVRELRQLLADRPGDPVVQNALGYTLADQDRDLPEARALIEASLAQTPDSAAVEDSMGWVLYRQKDYPKALEYLERAYARDPDPEIALHLGEVQWSIGDHTAARKTWSDALARSPGSKALEERLGRAGQ
ncbi:MAG: tetratricopeptide repeat protein [Steroidobacteraceae bacterium]